MNGPTKPFFIGILLLMLCLATRMGSGVRVAVPELYVITVGINQYPEWQLEAAVNDAVSFGDLLKNKAPFRKITEYRLLDTEATKQSIETAFSNVIAKAGLDDTFVFYFAGNARKGSQGRQKLYLIPFEVSGKSEDAVLDYNAISADLLKAWSSRIPALSQLFVFDTNNAEEVVRTFGSRIAAEGVGLLEQAGRNIAILGPEGVAGESVELQHGEFTYWLLRGLQGEAQSYPPSGNITTQELLAYLQWKLLPNYSEGGRIRGVASLQIGCDFPLVYVGERPKSFDYKTCVHRIRSKVVASRGAEDEKPAEPSAKPMAERKGRDYALLIATDDYENWRHLSNPVNDAHAMAEDLKDIYGVESRVLENPKKSEILSVLMEYLKKGFSPDDQLFIFIAGHGSYMEETQEGFLVARDSKRQQDDPFRESYIPFDRIRDIVNQYRAGHILVVLDSCFSGTFDRRISQAGSRSDDEYSDVSAQEFKLRKMKYQTRKYFTSGGKEYVPDGQPGHHSPFAAKILEALRSYGGRHGYVTVGEIKRHVERVTPEPRSGEFGSDEPGSDFVLISRQTAPH